MTRDLRKAEEHEEILMDWLSRPVSLCLLGSDLMSWKEATGLVQKLYPTKRNPFYGEVIEACGPNASNRHRPRPYRGKGARGGSRDRLSLQMRGCS